MRQPVIFFDMDGVLARFVDGSLARHGLPAIPPHDINWNFYDRFGLSDPEFWKPLEDSAFWASLEPHGDGMDLFGRVLAHVGPERIGFLSSPGCRGSVDGKKDWLSKHLPDVAKNHFFGVKKEMVAAPCKLLIDDHDPNIDKFAAAGGRTVLVPRSWNRRRNEIDAEGRFDPEALFSEVVSKL